MLIICLCSIVQKASLISIWKKSPYVTKYICFATLTKSIHSKRKWINNLKIILWLDPSVHVHNSLYRNECMTASFSIAIKIFLSLIHRHKHIIIQKHSRILNYKWQWKRENRYHLNGDQSKKENIRSKNIDQLTIPWFDASNKWFYQRSKSFVKSLFIYCIY